MRNLKNIMRHEFIGLSCCVTSSQNRSNIGLEGRIIDETYNTILVESKGKRKRILKKGTVFKVSVGKKKVEIQGDYIIARPEDRIKKKFKKW